MLEHVERYERDHPDERLVVSSPCYSSFVSPGPHSMRVRPLGTALARARERTARRQGAALAARKGTRSGCPEPARPDFQDTFVGDREFDAGVSPPVEVSL